MKTLILIACLLGLAATQFVVLSDLAAATSTTAGITCGPWRLLGPRACRSHPWRGVRNTNFSSWAMSAQAENKAIASAAPPPAPVKKATAEAAPAAAVSETVVLTPAALAAPARGHSLGWRNADAF